MVPPTALPAPTVPLSDAVIKIDLLRLRDSGIYGNGNLMLMEKNNHEVFGVIRDWLDKKAVA